MTQHKLDDDISWCDIETGLPTVHNQHVSTRWDKQRKIV